MASPTGAACAPGYSRPRVAAWAGSGPGELGELRVSEPHGGHPVGRTVPDRVGPVAGQVAVGIGEHPSDVGHEGLHVFFGGHGRGLTRLDLRGEQPQRVGALDRAADAALGHGGISLSSPGAPAGVLAAGFLLCVCVLVGLGLGAIIRHTAGAIAATIGVIYLVAVLCLAPPSPWNARIGRFTLPFAAYQVVARHPQAGLFSPGVSLLIVIAWPAAIVVTAGVLLTRRDL